MNNYKLYLLILVLASFSLPAFFSGSEHILNISAQIIYVLLFIFSGVAIFLAVVDVMKITKESVVLSIEKISHRIEKSVTFVSELSIFKSQLKALLLLEAISIGVFYRWLSFDIFISGDYHWIPAQTLAYLKPLSAWRSFLTTGEPNWVLWSGYSTSFFGFWGDLGLDSNVVMNVLVLWFLVLVAPILSFFFVRRFTKNIFSAFIFSLLLLFNGYVLTNIAVGHLLLSVAFYIGLAAFSFYSIFIESAFKKTYALLLATLLVWITGIIDFRIFYLLAICFLAYQVLYLILNKITFSFFDFLGKNGLFFVLLFLLNCNWLLPTSYIRGTNEILERPIFGKGLIDLFNSWSGTYYYWSLSNKIVWGVDTGFPAVFILLPLLVLLILYYSKKSPYLIIFTILFMFGAFFGKQNTAPFSRIYEFMYAHFPGFSAFRDATKIFQVTILALPIILALGYENTKNNLAKNTIVIITLLIVSLNIYAQVRYQDHLYVPTTIPDYYQDYFALESDTYQRIMWAPRHETIRTGTTTNPRLTFLEMKDTTWVPTLRRKTSPGTTNDFLKNRDLQALLAMSSVKYIFVPKQIQTYDMLINDDAFYYDDNREDIIKILDSRDWLVEKQINSPDASVYTLNVTRPHMYLTQVKENFYNMFDLVTIEVENKFINPSIYQIYLKNISNTTYLTFTDTYSEQWYLGPVFTSNWDFSMWKDVSFPQNNRFANKAGGNVFVIDKDFIKTVTDDYETNPDGSINATLTLYYSPQKQLIWGNYITLGTIGLIAIYFARLLIRQYLQKE